MGWKAGSAANGGGEEHPEAPETPGGRKTSKSVWWILGGLVVTGIVAGWKWVRGLPSDK